MKYAQRIYRAVQRFVSPILHLFDCKVSLSKFSWALFNSLSLLGRNRFLIQSLWGNNRFSSVTLSTNKGRNPCQSACLSAFQILLPFGNSVFKMFDTIKNGFLLCVHNWRLVFPVNAEHQDAVRSAFSCMLS